MIVIVKTLFHQLNTKLSDMKQCPPPWDQVGNDFCVISQAGGGGQLLNFKSQGGDTFRGEMILGSQAGGTALS